MNANEIANLSSVSPQQTFLESSPEKPSAASTLYLNRFTTTNNDQSKNHTIVGVHIKLKKDDPNGLWNALHIDRDKQRLDPKNPQVATRSVLICCDTLEVHGEFSLPEANVDIFARQLVWATSDAAINTSPLRWAVDKAEDSDGSAPGKDGATGRNAGSLRVFTASADSGGGRPRFLTQGGAGQHPGAGKDGKNGKSLSSWSSRKYELNDSGMSTSKADVSFSPPAVYIN